MIEDKSNLHDRIDRELAEALAAVPKSNGRIFDLGDLQGTRALIRQMAAQGEPAAAANTAFLVEAHEASRSREPPVPLRVFRPTNVRGALPAMLWFHGAGRCSASQLRRTPTSSGSPARSAAWSFPSTIVSPQKRARPPRRRMGLPPGAGSAAKRRRSAQTRSGSPSPAPAAAAVLRRRPRS